MVVRSREDHRGPFEAIARRRPWSWRHVELHERKTRASGGPIHAGFVNTVRENAEKDAELRLERRHGFSWCRENPERHVRRGKRRLSRMADGIYVRDRLPCVQRQAPAPE